jgi:glycosyltransferase involved in cell wall biosynthesis
MNVLFVHNNFPAQFHNLAAALAGDPANSVAAIGAETSRTMARVALSKYQMPQTDLSGTHPFARRFDAECRRAEQVLFAATKLAASGFSPDLIVAHCGWGENLPLRAVFPNAKIAVYCEFYYRAVGQDVHFDHEMPRIGADGVASLHCKNASTLIALADSDIGVSPTYWQRSTYPAEFQSKIVVGHEGIDTKRVRPNDSAQIKLPNGRTLHKGQEIVTFVSRNLEPMRGFHIFMRALQKILRDRPNANVVVVGGDGCSYGPPAPGGASWKTVCLNENSKGLDLSRVHFLDRLPYTDFLSVLQSSAVHVYLTYPFVLSWSLLEAMAAGCKIVASATAPVQEVIDGSNGILVPFFDSKALANAVNDVLAKPQDYVEFGKAARATIVARYDKQTCVPRVMRALGIEYARMAATA